MVVETLGFTVDACSEHAEEHAQWEAAVEEQRNPPDEPLPEEWCPDASLENATPVPHCPRHGTPAARGLADGVPS